MSYLTWREKIRSGPVCLGVLLIVAGAVVALLGTQDFELLPAYPGYTTMIGAVIAVVGLLAVVCGFFFTKKERDSVKTKVDTRQDDIPPPPPKD